MTPRDSEAGTGGQQGKGVRRMVIVIVTNNGIGGDGGR